MAEFSFPTIVIMLLVLDGLRNSPTNYHTLFDSMREYILMLQSYNGYYAGFVF